jgi:hypothetical protein
MVRLLYTEAKHSNWFVKWSAFSALCCFSLSFEIGRIFYLAGHRFERGLAFFRLIQNKTRLISDQLWFRTAKAHFVLGRSSTKPVIAAR